MAQNRQKLRKLIGNDTRGSVPATVSLGVTKKDKHTQTSVFSFCNPNGLPNPFGFDRLASDSKPLANCRLPSPYQGAETRRGHQKASTFVGAFLFGCYYAKSNTDNSDRAW